MPGEPKDKVNQLIGRRGSIIERDRIARELDDDQLQIAAPYSSQAQQELDRRRHERLLEGKQSPTIREREQKFGILYSSTQMQRDFDLWCSEAAGLTGYSIAVIFLDIDDFKQFNTNFTETVIDRSLLPDFQRLVAGLCLHRGAAYRVGGEEFIILLPNCSHDDAITFAQKVCRSIEANVFRVEDQVVHMTVSIGVAMWPNDGETLTVVVERANRVERQSKEQGKNRVTVYS
jgi:diguanylate cyclase (GGDEF)-like protein